MLITVILDKQVVGTNFSNFESARKALVEFFANNFSKTYFSNLRQVSLGEEMKGTDVVDTLQYFEKSDRLLRSPKHQVEYVYSNIQ